MHVKINNEMVRSVMLSNPRGLDKKNISMFSFLHYSKTLKELISELSEVNFRFKYEIK